MTTAPVAACKTSLPAIGGQAVGTTRVLHVLDHSLPEQSGYASRSHAILVALQRTGLQVEAITSPKHGRDSGEQKIDFVSYLRTDSENGEAKGIRGQLRTILATRYRVRDYLRRNDTAIVHAHSPCLNGLAVAGLGRPLVYEMRSSWEDAAVSSGTTTESSLRYRLSRLLETTVVRKADAVVVICEGLKRELVKRGVAEQRITVVPNAVPEEMLKPPRREQADALRNVLGLRGKRVIGFFGSFFEWEGVDSLVRVMSDVVLAMPEGHLLLAGGGRQEERLRALAAELGLQRAVTFAGRVGPDSIRDFYGAADVMVFPRVSERLTEMVTPLKPLEAMAQYRPVIASDVGGHRELVRHGETGFLYPAGDNQALARTIVEVLGGGQAIEGVKRAAREFIERERQWSVVSERYLPVYESVLGRPLEIAGAKSCRAH